MVDIETKEYESPELYRYLTYRIKELHGMLRCVDRYFTSRLPDIQECLGHVERAYDEIERLHILVMHKYREMAVDDYNLGEELEEESKDEESEED